MTQKLLSKIYERKEKGQKSFAVLIDPDKVNFHNFSDLLALCVQYKADYIFVGGSLIRDYVMDNVISRIKEHTNIPILLFPGKSLHIHNQAEAILLLSLISGRNPV
jgi:putative glycerol-1-phosphate prenyltransferase